MPATTPKGLPYPLPTEPVAEGAQAIRNLAEKIDPWLAAGAPSTTPPASPVDGQYWLFPADTAAGVMWLFRYRAASPSAYKWEFLGGSPWSAQASNPLTLAAAAWNGVAPDFIVPRSGDYHGESILMQLGVPVVNQQFQHGIANASLAATPVGLITYTYVSNYDAGVCASLLTGLAAGQTVRATINPPIANCTVAYRMLKLTPVRIA